MTDTTRDTGDACRLARAWIEGWQAGKPDELPLTDDFVHQSPFGRMEGRDAYLAWVKPLAAKNVATLRIERTIGTDDEAAILFEMDTPNGTVPVCDWVFVRDGRIREVRSFYDATGLKD